MNSTTNEIIAIPDNDAIENMLMGNSSMDDLFRLRGLRDRRIYIDEDINQYVVTNIVRALLDYNCDDKYIEIQKRRPVIIYINSNGGDVDAGFELIDVINLSKTPIYVVNLGYCYSMGFLIYIAGHKRFASENATFLIHDGSSFVSNSTSKARDVMNFLSTLEDRTKQYLLNQTEISEEEYDAKQRQEWYMFADEAKKYGIVDYILGEDVALDEVL